MIQHLSLYWDTNFGSWLCRNPLVTTTMSSPAGSITITTIVSLDFSVTGWCIHRSLKQIQHQLQLEPILYTLSKTGNISFCLPISSQTIWTVYSHSSPFKNLNVKEIPWSTWHLMIWKNRTTDCIWTVTLESTKDKRCCIERDDRLHCWVCFTPLATNYLLTSFARQLVGISNHPITFLQQPTLFYSALVTTKLSWLPSSLVSLYGYPQDQRTLLCSALFAQSSCRHPSLPYPSIWNDPADTKISLFWYCCHHSFQ